MDSRREQPEHADELSDGRRVCQAAWTALQMPLYVGRGRLGQIAEDEKLQRFFANMTGIRKNSHLYVTPSVDGIVTASAH